MKRLLKNLFNIIGGMLFVSGILALIVLFALYISPSSLKDVRVLGSGADVLRQHLPASAPFLIERIMDIQREVGCTMIDGEIGRESMAKINAQTEIERPLLHNKYAAEYMTSSGAPAGSKCPDTYFRKDK